MDSDRKELIDRIAASMDRVRRLGRARMRDDLAGFDMTMPQVRTAVLPQPRSPSA